MKINSKHIIFFVALIITLISVASAADINDTTLSSDVTTSTTSPDTQQTDTNVITESNNNHEIKNTQQTTKNVVQTENSGQTRNTTPKVWNISNANFSNIVTSNGLNSEVNDCDILNFVSDVTRTGSSYIIDKPVTILGNQYTLNLNTGLNYSKTSLNFVNGASNSNITGLNLLNTQVYVNTSSNITFDNIHAKVNNSGVGAGVGSFAIRDGSINVTVKNSYFETYSNGGYSTLVLTWAKNCTIENNTVYGTGNVGNLVYLNNYGGKVNANGIVNNSGNTIKDNTITAVSPGMFCYALTITGANNSIINNTISNNKNYSVTTSWAGSYEETNPGDTHNVSYHGNKYINNTINGRFSTGNYSIVEGNWINGTSTIVGHANVTNNTFLGPITINNNVRFHSNNATGQTVTVILSDSCFKNNKIGTLTITGPYNTYDCGGNTIGIISVNLYKKYFKPCNGTCPNCDSTQNMILLKKSTKNIKTQNEGELVSQYSLYSDNDLMIYNNGTAIITLTNGLSEYYASENPYSPKIDESSVEITDIIIYINYNPSFDYKVFNNPDNKNLKLVWNGSSLINKGFFISSNNFKSITYENFNINLNYPNSQSEVWESGSLILYGNNITLRNISYTFTSKDITPMANLASQTDNTGVSGAICIRGENILIENSEFTISQEQFINITELGLQDDFDDDFHDYGIFFYKSSNITFLNNTFSFDSMDKDSGIAPNKYSSIFGGKVNNLTLSDNKINVRYVPGIKVSTNNSQFENNEITVLHTDKTLELIGDNNIVRYNTLTAGEKEGDATVIVTGENNIVEQNPYVEPGPSTVITENTYSEFFDDECLLRPEFNNTDLTVSGNINEKIFIFDGVNVTITNDGTATLTNCQFSVGNDATVVLDGIKINNTDMDAIILESSGNIINNSEIIVTSAYPLHAVEIAEDGNIITNTIITATLPSADVAYDKDYVGLPQSSALYISSNNNLLDNVTVSVDSTNVAEGSYYPSIDAIDIQSTGKGVVIENNTITNSKVIATGSNYVYGINVGRAKDTTIENVNIDVDSDYYTNGIQLFDAVDIKIDGTIDSTAATQAYGVYATAMAVGTSSGIDLTGLNITVESPDATGVLIEGASDVIIADATYDISGDSATAVNAHVDWMGNIPENITVTGMDINIDTAGDANALYFGLCDDITITDNNIETTGGSRINFNKTSNAKVTDNYIVIKDITTGYYGNYAVMTNEDDTTVENNEPTTPVVEELQDEINNLTQTIEDQQQTIDDLQQQLEQLQQQLDQLNAPKATQILFDPIEAVYNSPVTITGELTDDKDNLLNNKNIIITFNGKTYTVKTKAGVFEFVTDPIKSMDEQTITAAFEGNEDYNATQATTTFTMNKQNTSISIDEIADVKYQDIVTITGTFKNANGQALTNSNVKVTVNGQTSTVKTDANGVFTLEYKASTMGENTVTVSYAGNAKYNGYETTTTFNTDKKDTILTIDEITDVKYQDTITIKGTFKNADGSALRNSNVVLYINGEYHTVRTDNNGVFTYEYKAITMGENNITVTYAGNARYNAAEATTTFTVDKKDTVMTVDAIADVNKGDSVTVTGTFKNSDGTAFRNSNVIVYVNGAHHTVKTDNNGNYNYTFTAKLVGDNEIRVVFNGNNKYNACETTTTFTVKE